MRKPEYLCTAFVLPFINLINIMKKLCILLLLCVIINNMTINAINNHKADNPQQGNTRTEMVFDKRMDVIGKQFFNLNGLNVTPEEKNMLEFLYAYMPLADITDYSTSFFLNNIRYSFKAKKEMTWGTKVPDILFKHFVIPIRVNNEALDSSRIVFYHELKERVNGKSMYDAILEVNHWCHEKVTYQPSDARTSSPLATVKTATGRCGEQSTFTVAALRSVGIPARQVYTPRWAHTDDNHAWVEAWADGKWYFLGACEPEPVLNLGWFNAPASRALLMHTRVFGDYQGPEEVILRSSNFTEINVTDNYADTSPLKITITDKNGKPLSDARVDFKIYNYAEFCTVATKYTDRNGTTSLTAGNGDMLIWASKGNCYAWRKVSFGKDRAITIAIDNKTTNFDSTQIIEDTITIVTPAEKAIIPDLSEEQIKTNQKRFAYEDSLRKAYTSTFLTKEQADKIADYASEYIVKSRGNHKTIVDYIDRHKDNPQRTVALLATLSDKDLRDITTEILEDNFRAQSDQISPRVEDEMIITPFKHYLASTFSKKDADKFRKDPAELAAWISKNIRIDTDSLALQIAQTPVGAMRSRITTPRSRDILFVDAARSLGIEARKDAVTSKVQYRSGNEWIDIRFDEKDIKKQSAKGKLILSYTPEKHLEDPLYYSHFTISKIENGCTQLLNMEEGQSDMGNGTTWSNTFKNGVTLDTGTYMLTTGTRLANGSVLASNKIFNIVADKTTTLSLDMRQSTSEVSVIGSFNSESVFIKDNKEVSILSQTGRGYYVLGVINSGQEPTNHTLHDIEKIKKQFEQWGRPLVLLFENSDGLKKFNTEEFSSLPSGTIFGTDKNGEILQQLVQQMKINNKRQLPIFIIADTFNRVVFVSQGYTIGIGEQMLNVIKKL